MRRFLAVLALAGAGLIWSGCQPPATPLAPLASTATASPAPSPTATVVWFPPTATPTPPPPTPVPTPTPDLQAGLGAVLVQTPFQQADQWRSPTGYAGRFGVDNGVLTVTVLRRRGTMVVLHRELAAHDFYLDVEAQPQVCRDGDAYGVVVRSTAGGGRYYRFGVTCDGTAFVELVEGQLPVPQASAPASVPPGALVRVRLSVRAQGKQMHFAVNGQVLFTVKDEFPSYGHDSLGFFARAAGEDGVIVRFRDLTLRAVR